MPVFSYEARTESGELLAGMINAATTADAGKKLSQQGHYVIKLGATDIRDQEASDRDDASRLKARRQSVMWFMNQLAIMVETGITIGNAMDLLARQATEPAMQEILREVSTAIKEGRPLSDSLEQYPRSFPPVSVAMIRASEASGTLSVILNRVADYMLKDQEAMSRLRGALMYPAFMFLMCISVTIFLLTVILPRFAVITRPRAPPSRHRHGCSWLSAIISPPMAWRSSPALSRWDLQHIGMSERLRAAWSRTESSSSFRSSGTCSPSFSRAGPFAPWGR